MRNERRAAVCVEIRREFPALLDAVDEISLHLREELGERCGRADIFASELLCREALTNAVVHGCELDPTRQVHLAIKVCRDRLVFAVRDDGAGFDWRSALNHMAEDDDDCGRGVEIYRAYADRFRFNQSGNGLIVVRRFSRGDKEA